MNSVVSKFLCCLATPKQPRVSIMNYVTWQKNCLSCANCYLKIGVICCLIINKVVRLFITVILPQLKGALGTHPCIMLKNIP